MIKSFRNYTPFLYRLIILVMLPFSIIAGDIAMVIYLPHLPYDHKKSVDTFMRFLSMCPIAMVYTIIISDVMVFKGIFSKENKFEGFLILSENGKKIVKNVVVMDAYVKVLLMVLSMGICLFISMIFVPDMYVLTGFRINNGLSIMFNGIILVQLGTWVVRHFLNWAHLLWVIGSMYTIFVPMAMSLSLWGPMPFSFVMRQAVWAIMATLLNVFTIQRKVKKVWYRD